MGPPGVVAYDVGVEAGRVCARRQRCGHASGDSRRVVHRQSFPCCACSQSGEGGADAEFLVDPVGDLNIAVNPFRFHARLSLGHATECPLAVRPGGFCACNDERSADPFPGNSTDGPDRRLVGQPGPRPPAAYTSSTGDASRRVRRRSGVSPQPEAQGTSAAGQPQAGGLSLARGGRTQLFVSILGGLASAR